MEPTPMNTKRSHSFAGLNVQLRIFPEQQITNIVGAVCDVVVYRSINKIMETNHFLSWDQANEVFDTIVAQLPAMIIVDDWTQAEMHRLTGHTWMS